MFEHFEDNIVVADPDKGSEFLFHRRTLAMALWGILTHYLRWEPVRAEQAVAKYLARSLGNDYYASMYFGHEGEYHCAMPLAHGDYYWNRGFTQEWPVDLDQWWDTFKATHNLPAYFIEYPDE